MTLEKPCFCGSGKVFAACCGPLLAGTKRAETAEDLMRSRYSAHVVKDGSYLLTSWHPSTRPSKPILSFSEWYRLKILDTKAGKAGDTDGIVEFFAWYRYGNKEGVLHERSRFRKEEESWYYLDGKGEESSLTEQKKVGRNSPCPCGSGKKYKKCCLR